MDETTVTPAPETEELPAEPVTVEVVDIQFRPGQKVYFFDPAGMDIPVGAHLIIDTARGPEFGTCTGANHPIPEKDVVTPLRSVIRLATEADEKTVADNRQKEKRAYNICMQKIEEHKLDMQLVSAEYAFDGSKILFFFTADERVDFRELVKNLASIFHTRIELRQIGVRDKAKMVGGLGICGRPFCCAQFLDDFQPVSIKMAKTQNLSLNPTKISGACGRLMCCLKYEQEAYEDLIRTSPKMDSFVDTPDGRGTVVEVNLLRQSVKVRMEKNPETVTTCANADLAVLRSGKAKKNDPPIPADLAPISGPNGRRNLKPKEEEEPLLDPVKFRYRMDSVVDEPEEKQAERPAKPERPERSPRADRAPKQPQNPEKETSEGSEQRTSRRRRRPRNPRPGETPEKRPEGAEKPERTERPEKTERSGKPDRPPRRPRPEKTERPASGAPETPKAPRSAEPGDAPAGQRRRPSHFRRRRPKAPGEGSQEG